MNEQDQKNPKQEPPKNNLGGRNAAPASAYKKTLSRKWISPALFVAAAAIIVTVMWLYQGDDKKTSTTEIPDSQVAQGGEQQPAPVTVKPVPGETAKWPVASNAAVTVQRNYFDEKATDAEKEAALVEQGNTFSANTGIDLARSDDQPFDVLAVLSGKVTLVQDQPTNGTVVEITHADGLVSVYQSLTNVTVKQGDDVKQSTVIGKAGQNELQKDLGVHLHFALLKNSEHVNPTSILPAIAAAMAPASDEAAASKDDSN